MRVLFFSQYFWPEDFRGNDIVAGLVERGHEVTVVTGLPNYPGGELFEGYSFFRGPFREVRNGVEILRCPLIPRGRSSGLQLALNYLSYALFCSLMVLLRRRKTDLVFCWMLTPITQVLPAIVAKYLCRAPLVIWVMDLWPDSLSASGRVNNGIVISVAGALTRWIYRRCDLILGQTRRFVDHIRAVGRLSGDNVGYLPQWEPAPVQHEVDVAGLPVMPDGFRIMFTGNIGHSQDFGTIIEAARLLSARKDIHWVILGAGDALAEVEQRRDALGLQDNFHTLGRHPFETMPYFYGKADVLLATLKPADIFSRTIPTKIQSYLASGRPLITAIDGEVAEVIGESGAGIAVASGDAVALARAVEAMAAKTGEERRRMGEAGRAYFDANFDRETTLDRLVSILSEQAGKTAGDRPVN